MMEISLFEIVQYITALQTISHVHCCLSIAGNPDPDSGWRVAVSPN